MQTLRLWDFRTGESKVEFRGHEHVVECLTFAPATAHETIKELLASAADAKTAAAAAAAPVAPKNPDQAYLLSGSRDRTIKLWDTVTGQCVYTFTGHDNWVRGVVFHPSGKFIISVGDDKTMRVWDLKTGRCLKTYEAHSHFVTSIAFNQRSPLVATGSVDQVVKIWECR